MKRLVPSRHADIVVSWHAVRVHGVTNTAELPDERNDWWLALDGCGRVQLASS